MSIKEATHRTEDMAYRKDGGLWYYWSKTHESGVPSIAAPGWVEANAKPTRPPQDPAVATAPHDTVNNPKHYQLLPGVEVYDIRQALASKASTAGATLDQFSDYDRAVEYLLRMWEKNGVEDAKKAAWYLNKLVEKLSDGRQQA